MCLCNTDVLKDPKIRKIVNVKVTRWLFKPNIMSLFLMVPMLVKQTTRKIENKKPFEFLDSFPFNQNYNAELQIIFESNAYLRPNF